MERIATIASSEPTLSVIVLRLSRAFIMAALMGILNYALVVLMEKRKGEILPSFYNFQGSYGRQEVGELNKKRLQRIHLVFILWWFCLCFIISMAILVFCSFLEKVSYDLTGMGHSRIYWKEYIINVSNQTGVTQDLYRILQNYVLDIMAI